MFVARLSTLVLCAFVRELFLVLLINQKDYEHIKKDEANMVTQKTWGEASMVKNRIKNVEYLRQNLRLKMCWWDFFC